MIRYSFLILLAGCVGIDPGLNIGPVSLNQRRDNRASDDSQNRRLNDLERRIELLEKANSMTNQVLDLVGVELSELQEADELLEVKIDQILQDLQDLETDVAGDVSLLESQVTNLEADVAALQLATDKSVAELIDPCGDGPGFDEILLKLADGTLIAYFQQGSRRHLAVLEPGNYRTTDQQRCNFTVTATGDVI